MIPLILSSFFEFIRQELPLARQDFSSIYTSVRDCPISPRVRRCEQPYKILHAVDLASVFYFKEVKCLQRSATAARLLRKHGFPAQLVIGIQQIPFRAHAWVEIDGSIVNDRSYISGMYAVIERC